MEKRLPVNCIEGKQALASMVGFNATEVLEEMVPNYKSGGIRLNTDPQTQIVYVSVLVLDKDAKQFGKRLSEEVEKLMSEFQYLEEGKEKPPTIQ